MQVKHRRNEHHTDDQPRSWGERGASLVEYVLLIAMIAIVCLSALSYFGGSSGNSVGHSKDCILAAGTGHC